MSTWTWPSLLRSRLQNSSIVIIHSHFSFVFLIFLLPLLSLCVHVSVEGERPLAGVSSFFLLCGSWRSDSGCRVWECPCLFSFWPALQAGTLNGHLRATEKKAIFNRTFLSDLKYCWPCDCHPTHRVLCLVPPSFLFSASEEGTHTLLWVCSFV